MKAIKGYLLIAAAASFWGIAGTIAKYLFNRDIDPLIIVQTRVTFSCILLFVFFALFRREILLIKRKDFMPLALLGIIGIAGSNFFHYVAMDLTNVATAILLQYTAPIFVVLYSWIFHRERLYTTKVLALVFSVLGCFLAVGGGGTANFEVNPVGIILAVSSAIAFAFLSIYGRSLSFRYPTWMVLLYALFFASLFWLVVNPPWVIMNQQYSSNDWGIFLGFAVLSILIPYSLYLHGLRQILSSRAVITSTLEPIVAVTTAYVFLGEIPTPVQMIGALLVLMAIGLLQVRREETLVQVAER